MENKVKEVLKEFEDLDDKIKELSKFIYSDNLTTVAEDLGSEGVDLLCLQLETMKQYRMILEMRLGLMGETNVNLR